MLNIILSTHVGWEDRKNNTSFETISTFNIDEKEKEIYLSM
jgi:hypothetical protein